MVEGHTDYVGNPTSNKVLSENRTKEVFYLFKKPTAFSFLFEIKGYGESQPIPTNDTNSNRQKNRRVEILVMPN